jgi:hypothetical protein
MNVFAYTDESGNSGLELFNTDQRVFWTGTLISPRELDSAERAFHKELLDTVGDSELHGAKLGFPGLEKIAARVAWFVRHRKLRFSYSRIDKQFLAATKFVDLVLDSGNNLAVPGHTYGVRLLRLLNAMHLVQLLDRQDLEMFWTLFRRQDATSFSDLQQKIRLRVMDAPFDERSKEILGDALLRGPKTHERFSTNSAKWTLPMSWHFQAYSGTFTIITSRPAIRSLPLSTTLKISSYGR